MLGSTFPEPELKVVVDIRNHNAGHSGGGLHYGVYKIVMASFSSNPTA
jgi:hypothetical protein